MHSVEQRINGIVTYQYFGHSISGCVREVQWMRAEWSTSSSADAELALYANDEATSRTTCSIGLSNADIQVNIVEFALKAKS